MKNKSDQIGVFIGIAIFCIVGRIWDILSGKMDGNSLGSRSEIISLCLRIGFLSIGTFFTVRWIVNQMDPTKKQKVSAKKKAQEQLKKIGLQNVETLSDYEMMIASHLVDPTDIPITWKNIAGLDDVIQELKETVILPVKRKDLFQTSNLTQPPKGVLMYGPPGCGKTLIAKATAREAGMRFINLDVSILTDKWYGESQKLASAVFSLAVKLQPCIIFIDEIDSFLRNRNTHDHEATAMMKAQFMSLWDGLVTDADCTVIVMGATNRPQDLDRAILRRMPATFAVRLPNTEQRCQIINLILNGEPLDNDVDINRLAQQTEGFSGSDLREMCRHASIYRVRDFIRNSISNDEEDEEPYHDALRPITMCDLMTSLQKMRESKIQCGTLVIE